VDGGHDIHDRLLQNVMFPQVTQLLHRHLAAHDGLRQRPPPRPPPAVALPVLGSQVVLFPGFGRRIGHPGQELAQMSVARRGQQAEDLEGLARQRLEVAPVVVEPAVAQQRVKVFAGLPVTDLVGPGEVVDPRRLDVQMLQRRPRHRDEIGHVVGVGVDMEARRHGNAPAVGQHRPGHGVAPQQLVAQPQHLDRRVAGHAPRQADQGVGQVEVPGVRAKLLHVVGDVQHQRHVAGGVGNRAGAAVLRIRLVHAVAQRDLPVHLPDRLPVADLHGDDHEVGVAQHVAAVGRAANGHARAPRLVENLRQAGHGLQRRLVDIDQGQLRAAHPLRADDGRHSPQTEDGATCADDDDFWRLDHSCPLRAATHRTESDPRSSGTWPGRNACTGGQTPPGTRQTRL